MSKISKNTIHYFLIMFLYILTPLAYLVNAYLYIGLIIVQGFALVKKVGSLGNKLTILLFHTVLYSGTSFVGMHLYDWVILFMFAYFFVMKKGRMKITARMLPFLIIVILQALTHFTGTSVILESVRYIICIVLLIITLNESFDFNKIINEIICINLANIYYAVVIYTYIASGIYKNINTNLVHAQSYVYTTDIRMNGFFSDPNKYMVFCFLLLFIAEAFITVSKKRNFLVLSILLASVISFSRTALIVIAAYFALKILIIVKERSTRLFFGLLVCILLVVTMLLMMPNLISNLIDGLYVFSARMLGRGQALDLSATLEGDNRPRIWRMTIDFIEEQPILGYGWLSNEYLLPYPTHNTVLALLLDGGIVALIGYIYLFWPMIKCKRWDILISCCFVSTMMLDLQNYRMWFFLLGLIMNKSIIINQATHGFLKKKTRWNDESKVAE